MKLIIPVSGIFTCFLTGFVVLCLFVPFILSQELGANPPFPYAAALSTLGGDDYDPAVDFGCSFSADAKILALSNLEDQVRIIDLERKTEICRIGVPFEASRGTTEYGIEFANPFRHATVRLSPDGSQLAFLPFNLIPLGDTEELVIENDGYSYKDEKLKKTIPPAGIRYRQQKGAWLCINDATNGKLLRQFMLPTIVILNGTDNILSSEDWKNWKTAYAIEKVIKNPSVLALADIEGERSIGFSRSIALTQNNERPKNFSFSNDFKKLYYVTTGSGAVLDHPQFRGLLGACVDVETGDLLKVFQCSSMNPRTLSAHDAALPYDDEKKLVILAHDHSKGYAIFDTESGNVISQSDDVVTGKSGNGFHIAAVDESGKYLATSNTGGINITPFEQFVLIRDLSTGKVKCLLVLEKDKNCITSLRFSKDGKYLAAGLLRGNVYVWDVDQKKLVNKYISNVPKQAGTIVEFGQNNDELVIVFLQNKNVSAEVVKWSILDGKEIDRFAL